MMQRKFKTQGFTVTGLLLVIVIIILLGFVGWYIYHTDHKTTPVASTTTSTKSSTKSTSTQSVFKIPEFGVELINVPTSLVGLTYTVSPTTSPSYSAVFSTASLAKLDPACTDGAIGALSKVTGTYDATTDFGADSSFVKQFSGFWLSYAHEQADCSTLPSATTLETSQSNVFETLVTNSNNVQLIQ